MKIHGENMNENLINDRNASELCPVCDASGLIETMELQRFPYGDEGTELIVEVPVAKCSSCGFEFLDSRAEVLRHEAVCAHEGLLTPAQIKQVRSKLGMTRRQFAEAFGIPRASMDRWETGKLLQNKSLDTLLRALENPGTAVRLDRRAHQAPAATGTVVQFPTLERSFEALAEAQSRQTQFRLRASG
jgi:putative zinc finger/helix-turn-helix YgiT family protein